MQFQVGNRVNGLDMEFVLLFPLFPLKPLPYFLFLRTVPQKWVALILLLLPNRAHLVLLATRDIRVSIAAANCLVYSSSPRSGAIFSPATYSASSQFFSMRQYKILARRKTKPCSRIVALLCDRPRKRMSHRGVVSWDLVLVRLRHNRWRRRKAYRGLRACM